MGEAGAAPCRGVDFTAETPPSSWTGGEAAQIRTTISGARWAGPRIDLAKVAGVCGFATAETLTGMAEVEMLSGTLQGPAAGPRLFVIKVAPENPPRSLPSRDAVYIKNRFRAHLGLAQG